MFDPRHYESILHMAATDLATLPVSEDDRHEYKGSATTDDKLAQKINQAASAFWNSGGGLFVAGVGNGGQPNGGIGLTVGRQSRRDWIDQHISLVSPPGRYAVQCLEDSGAGLNILPGRAIVLIAFALSETGPHMAHDHRYYIRAGAHTGPAPHFLVEAIHARRGLRTPMLRHVVRRNPESGGILQLGLICLNEAPALDVEITLEPLPHSLEVRQAPLPLVVPVISPEAPFFFDFHTLSLVRPPEIAFHVKLKYRDLADRTYQTDLAVDVYKQLGPYFAGRNDFKDLIQAVEKVAAAMQA